MIHLSLNLQSPSAARVAAYHAKRLYPLAASGERGVPGTTPPPPVLPKDDSDNRGGGVKIPSDSQLWEPEPLKMFLKVLNEDKGREQGSPWCFNCR